MTSRRRKSKTACLILAAGKGTRMNSAKNKVLHTLLGRPMVAYAVDRVGLYPDPMMPAGPYTVRKASRVP